MRLLAEFVIGALSPGKVVTTFALGTVELYNFLHENPAVEFLLDGRRVEMGEGEAWYLDLNLPHAVVNASPSMSGRYPNGGPIRIVNAGIPLLDGAGPGIMDQIREGDLIEVLFAECRVGDAERPSVSGGDPFAVYIHALQRSLCCRCRHELLLLALDDSRAQGGDDAQARVRVQLVEPGPRGRVRIQDGLRGLPASVERRRGLIIRAPGPARPRPCG